MHEDLKDRWGIPIAQNIIGGAIVGIPLIFLTAWMTGVPIKSVITLAGLKNVLFAPTPAWVLLISVFGFGVALVKYVRNAGERHRRVLALESAADALEANHAKELQKWKKPPARVEVVWTPGTCWWGKDMVNGEEGIYLRGMVHISTKDVHVDVTLIQAQVNGNAPTEFGPLFIRHGGIEEIELFLDTAPPLGKETETLAAQITFIDNRNRRYTIPEHTFRWNTAKIEAGEVAPVGRPEYPIPGRNYWE